MRDRQAILNVKNTLWLLTASLPYVFSSISLFYSIQEKNICTSLFDKMFKFYASFYASFYVDLYSKNKVSIHHFLFWNFKIESKARLLTRAFTPSKYKSRPSLSQINCLILAFPFLKRVTFNRYQSYVQVWSRSNFLFVIYSPIRFSHILIFDLDLVTLTLYNFE